MPVTVVEGRRGSPERITSSGLVRMLSFVQRQYDDAGHVAGIHGRATTVPRRVHSGGAAIADAVASPCS
jgi:hypothetical protein